MLNYYDTAEEALKAVEAQTTPEAKANKLFAIVHEWALDWQWKIKVEQTREAETNLWNTLELIRACNTERIFMNNQDVQTLLDFKNDFITSIIQLQVGEQADIEKYKRGFLRVNFPNFKDAQTAQEPQPETAPQYPWRAIQPQPDLSLLELGDKEELARAVFYIIEQDPLKWMVLENGKYRWKAPRGKRLLLYICSCINAGSTETKKVLAKGSMFENAGLFEAYFLNNFSIFCSLFSSLIDSS